MTTWMTWWSRRLSDCILVLVFSNDHLDDMVNQEIERLKDFIKNRPANLTTGTATMEEELYDAQVRCFGTLHALVVAGVDCFYIPLFSALEQIHCTCCDSDEWLAFYSMFLNIHRSSSHTLWINRSAKTVETVLRIVWGGEVGQLGEHWAGILLMQVQFPVVGR